MWVPLDDFTDSLAGGTFFEDHPGERADAIELANSIVCDREQDTAVFVPSRFRSVGVYGSRG